MCELRDKVVLEIESGNIDFTTPRVLSGVDTKDTIVMNLNKEILNKHLNQVSDEVMSLMTPISTHGLAHNHILSVDMFSKEQLNDIFNLAQTLRVYVAKGRSLDSILKVSVCLFILDKCCYKYESFRARSWH